MKIGIFGGTFSPPHMGHIKAAEAFLEELGLHRLIVIPALIPPNKQGVDTASPEDRLAMCRLAFSDPRFLVSDIEMAMGGVSYTCRTLEKLRDEYPEDELFLLLGEDKLANFGGWRGADRIFALSVPVFVRREDSDAGEALINEKINQYREQFGADVRRISVKAFPLSSEGVRDMIGKKEDVSGVLPEAVFGYITERGLYL